LGGECGEVGEGLCFYSDTEEIKGVQNKEGWRGVPYNFIRGEG